MGDRARWLEAPSPDWDALCRDDENATPAHAPALTRALVENLPGAAMSFVSVEDDAGALLGGALVVLERRLGFHWLRALPFTWPGAPLARRGAHARVDRAIAEALATRAADARIVGGEWVLFRPAGPPVDDEAIARLAGETRVANADVVDLSEGIATALRRVDRRARESIAMAGARGLRIMEDGDALEPVYALYRAQARSWRGHRPRSLALLRGVLRSGCARLFTVRDARGLLGGVVALVGAHEWMPWWSGAHPDARRHRAFTALVWSIAEAAAGAGARRLDLGGSAGLSSVASYKRDLGARSMPVPIRWIDSSYASPLGRGVAALQERMRAGRWRGAPA
jgi:Acetyltransferase (GNAT) domain